jgi:hypothetical protein
VADIPLAAPRDLEDLYLGRHQDLVLARPVLSGDVFERVELDLPDHDGRVMVIAHPCSMRGQRGRLRDRLTVAPIRVHQDIPFARWPEGHYNVFPLSQLLGAKDVPRAVDLRDLSTARSERLEREHRVLALRHRGIHILQQRLVYSLTRVTIGLEKFDEQSAHVLLEAELEEEWVDDLAGDEDAAARAAASEAFAEYLDGGLREQLLEPDRRSDVTRQVRIEIRERRDAAA